MDLANMRYHRAIRFAVLCSMILIAIAWNTTDADAQRGPVPSPGDGRYVGERYFVDFHARVGPSLVGHLYIVYGRLNAEGKIVQAQIAGHFPSEPNSLALLVPVRGSVGQTKYDFVEPSVDVYRRRLTSTEFKQLSTMVRQLKGIEPPYHLLFFNCNDFAGEAAESIGLRRPPGLMLPSTYVAWLRALNGD